MIFPALPGVTDGFTVLAVVPERSLVLGWVRPGDTQMVTWAFIPEALGDLDTRLIVRAHRRYSARRRCATTSTR
jgi:uncharacterized protein YndB with AHSA1/START domain